MSARNPAWLVVAAAVLWGTTGTAQGLGPDSVGPDAVGGARLVIGSSALLLTAAVARQAPRWSDLRRVPILVAGGAMAAYQPLFFGGVARTGVAVGTVIAIGSAPILAGGLTILLEREHPRAHWWRATGTGVLGLAVLVFAAGTEATLDLGGAVLCLGAGAAYAVYAVASRRIAPTVSALRSAAAVFVVAALLVVPLLARSQLDGLRSTGGITIAVWLGVVATALAYWLYMSGLRGVTAPTAATLSLAEPVTASILGVLILSERPPPLSWVGALLVLVGLSTMIRAAAQPS